MLRADKKDILAGLASKVLGLNGQGAACQGPRKCLVVIKRVLKIRSNGFVIPRLIVDIIVEM